MEVNGMYPVLLRWRGIRIYSFPALLYLGAVLGLLASNHVAELSGLESQRVLIAMVALIVIGLIGARLLFVAINWRLYRHDPHRIWGRLEGGAALQGGLLLAVAASLPVLTALGLPFDAFWDAATPSMAIGLVLGRLGCLLNGCCGGIPADGRFALTLPGHRRVWRRRIPTQLCEAGLGVLILLGAIGLWDERPFPGSIFLAAATIYGWGRLALEPLREERDRIGAIDVQRAFAAAIGTLALTGLLIRSLAPGS
jgi:prolipoprotein diacylglyceryltransferase